MQIVRKHKTAPRRLNSQLTNKAISQRIYPQQAMNDKNCTDHTFFPNSKKTVCFSEFFIVEYQEILIL